MKSRRPAGAPAAYKRSDPARIALYLLWIALAIIILSSVYAIRYGHPAQTPPVLREPSRSACPTPPPGYTPCDPIPTNTGFQTGDVG